MALVLGMPHPDGSRLHPFFAQKDRDHEDQTIHPRKRQKSSSPPSSNDDGPNHEERQDESWIDQLNEAAKTASAAVAEDPEAQASADAETEREQNVDTGNELPGIASDPVGTEASNENCDPGAVQHVISTLEDASRALNATPSPPKKMLRVRADGKLSSPKQNEPTNTRGRKSRRAKQQVEFEETGVIILKYGKRKKIRLEIGAKIDTILSGEAVLINGQVIARPRERTAIISKPTHPFFSGALNKDEPLSVKATTSVNLDKTSKPTHPFFTGETTKSSKERIPPQQGSEDLRQQQEPRSVSPRRMRVNSKPPGLGSTSKPEYEGKAPVFGMDRAKTLRFPGARDPIWPPSDMLQLNHEESPLSAPNKSLGLAPRTRKLKDKPIAVSREEDVLLSGAACSDIASIRYKIEQEGSPGSFRRPQRHVMTGKQLQSKIRPRLLHELTQASSDSNSEIDKLSIQYSNKPMAPTALSHIYNRISTERSAFDWFECEHQQWNQKYAPASAEDVLQSGKEAIFIRDWLKSLTVSSVTMQSHAITASKSSRSTKKKRKRKEGLEDFLVSSDDDDTSSTHIYLDRDSELAGNDEERRAKQTFFHHVNHKPGGRLAHAAVLSGPSGCGKSATVYAVAKELGFEIFEINAGSRRSGKDILERVGDMVHNHLVKNETTLVEGGPDVTAEEIGHDEKLQQDLDSGRQKTMGSFFNLPTRSAEMKTPKPRSDTVKPKATMRDSKSRKQSLILLEEVDVLFEDDKPFWSTVFDLIASTRRPLIMTCTNEDLLPLDDMDLYGIFRFTSPPAKLAIDYLLLIACSEGHLLLREAVSMLYEAKNHDLRATMAEIQVHCQMAVGDRKGGLEWMLLDQPKTNEKIDRQSLRVVSEDTYQMGMGWLGESAFLQRNVRDDLLETDTLQMACHEWNLDINELVLSTYRLDDCVDSSPQTSTRIDDLKLFEQVLEGHCIADLLPSAELRQSKKIPLDTTQPSLSSKQRAHYIDGISLAQADTLEDQTDLGSSIAASLHVFARHLWDRENTFSFTKTVCEAIASPERKIRAIVPSPKEEDLVAALTPLAVAEKSPQISVIDAPLSIIAADVAPYVRSIALYDLHLEQQRQALSGGDGKGKKARKTRASWAALEGGHKASTRREKWWKRDLDLDLAVKTAGPGWQDAVRTVQVMHDSEGDEDTERSRDSTVEVTEDAQMDLL